VTVLSKEFFDDRWERGNIPIKLRGVRLKDYAPVPNPRTGEPHKSGIIAHMEAQAFVEEFSDHYISAKRAANGNLPANRHNIGKGLLFHGHNGTRKTTLAVSILTEIQHLNYGYFGFYIRFSDWKRSLTDTFAKEETERTLLAKKYLKLAELSPLLVLDDIGQEHRTSSGFTESSLHELLRVRYEAARPTIVTTNIDPEFMRETYGASFDSFRHDAFTTLELLGRDSRQIKD
jgi:DNA replication protein DnaC